MSTISIDDVKKLAKLSNLMITDQEAEKLSAELQTIVGFFDQLNEADTDGIDPSSQITGLVNVTRPDEIVEYGVDQAGLLQNVPATEDGYIKVKRVLGE